MNFKKLMILELIENCRSQNRPCNLSIFPLQASTYPAPVFEDIQTGKNVVSMHDW